MLPEEAPKLTLTDAKPLGQCIDCLAVERALSDERQGSCNGVRRATPGAEIRRAFGTAS
jgi:hypothetical protein